MPMIRPRERSMAVPSEPFRDPQDTPSSHRSSANSSSAARLPRRAARRYHRRASARFLRTPSPLAYEKPRFIIARSSPALAARLYHFMAFFTSRGIPRSNSSARSQAAYLTFALAAFNSHDNAQARRGACRAECYVGCSTPGKRFSQRRRRAGLLTP